MNQPEILPARNFLLEAGIEDLDHVRYEEEGDIYFDQIISVENCTAKQIIYFAEDGEIYGEVEDVSFWTSNLEKLGTIKKISKKEMDEEIANLRKLFDMLKVLDR